MLNNKWFAVAALAVAALSSACSSTGDKNAADGASANAVRPTSTGSVATTPSSGNTGSASGTVPSSSQSIVYFDFDSNEVKAESQGTVAAWARYLTANPTAKVQLQGNTDERGTREYNLALGERRSQAVSSALQSAGASGNQLSLTSFGEERPVALGHDEASWSQNRRVEIVAQ